MSIEIRNVNKTFGDFTALNNINITVPTGKLTTLLGPSGCGKTTLLRIIAGLEYADSGQILFDDLDVTNIPVQKRHIGFMFQHYALFRHKNIADNIAFGLTLLPKSERPSKTDIKKRVAELLELVQLPQLANAYPHQLSGGQRQTINLARSLLHDPQILLLDEPTSSMDQGTEKNIIDALENFGKAKTMMIVTHRNPILTMVDRVFVIENGKIITDQSPQQLGIKKAGNK